MKQEIIDYLIANLPTRPPEGMIAWAEEECRIDLGGEYLLFKNERVRLAPTMEQAMCDNRSVGRSIWATRCTCTACGEDFITRKGETNRSFFLAVGDDGMTYPDSLDGRTDPEWLEATDGQCVEYTTGDGAICSWCGCELHVIHESEVRGGRTKRIQVATLTNVGKFTTIMYWLVERTVSEYGTMTRTAPRFAYVLGERGGLAAFSHRRPGPYGIDYPADYWRPLIENIDRWELRYGDWGSINNVKVGSTGYPYLPPEREMVGTTGEKTGLYRYCKETETYRPVEYLKMWRKRRNIENLVNAGFSQMVANAIGQGIRFAYDPVIELEKAADLRKTKPHEMLGLTKAELKMIRLRDTAYEILKLWQRYKAVGGKENMDAFLAAGDQWGGSGINTVCQLIYRWGDCDLGKLQRYLEKQGQNRSNGLGLLMDTRSMAEALAGNRQLTSEELWPRALHATHDRLAEVISAQKNKDKNAKLQAGFNAVAEKYASLQWNDGHLAVILPRSNQELVNEGRILRHCVGSYGAAHAKGEKIILFVRHYRRPERSYYTLNMDFSGSAPVRIQLHGYGNEWHGEHKQHQHSIPKEVLAFVDRWEKEIVPPWWRAQKKNNDKEKSA